MASHPSDLRNNARLVRDARRLRPWTPVRWPSPSGAVSVRLGSRQPLLPSDLASILTRSGDPTRSGSALARGLAGAAGGGGQGRGDRRPLGAAAGADAAPR